jgi:hypothetical protein
MIPLSRCEPRAVDGCRAHPRPSLTRRNAADSFDGGTAALCPAAPRKTHRRASCAAASASAPRRQAQNRHTRVRILPRQPESPDFGAPPRGEKALVIPRVCRSTVTPDIGDSRKSAILAYFTRPVSNSRGRSLMPTFQSPNFCRALRVIPLELPTFRRAAAVAHQFSTLLEP